MSETPEQRLAELEARVKSDLALIEHPRMPWLTPRRPPDGGQALDVLIVGAGQSGIATAFGLKRSRVDNFLIVDMAARGAEGPWLTFARMPTLRSPKDYTGPDLDIPSLTYPSWHIARFGQDSWDAVKLIDREAWGHYLLWVRDTIGLEVENGTAITAIAPAGDLLAADLLNLATGERRRVHARKIVLATGQDGMGKWWMPPEVEALPVTRRAHAADDIDFETLKGAKVAVLGAGASAFDNAGAALEAGAAEVMLFSRRHSPQVIQPYRWLTFKGFLAHLGDLEDEWRWRFMRRILGLREGFPQETYDRCARHANFRLIGGAPWTSVSATEACVEISTPKGDFTADFVISGTGVEMDFALRPELSACADNIATWGDKYTPPKDERHDRLGRFPYLDPDFALVEKRAGETPWIKDIHLFSIASTMSFGPSGSSINAMTTVVPKLVLGITKGLFRSDVEAHWESLKAYNTPQAIIPDDAVE